MRIDAFLMAVQFTKWNHFSLHLSVIYHKEKISSRAYDKSTLISSSSSYDAQQKEIEKSEEEK